MPKKIKIRPPAAHIAYFTVRCNLHPRYRAISKPRIECECCQTLWNMNHNPEFPVNELDLLMDQFNQDRPIGTKKYRWSGWCEKCRCHHKIRRV